MGSTVGGGGGGGGGDAQRAAPWLASAHLIDQQRLLLIHVHQLAIDFARLAEEILIGLAPILHRLLRLRDVVLRQPLHPLKELLRLLVELAHLAQVALEVARYIVVLGHTCRHHARKKIHESSRGLWRRAAGARERDVFLPKLTLEEVVQVRLRGIVVVGRRRLLARRLGLFTGHFSPPASTAARSKAAAPPASSRHHLTSRNEVKEFTIVLVRVCTRYNVGRRGPFFIPHYR